MRNLTPAQAERLTALFGAAEQGGRLNLDPSERTLYAHDLGSVPSLISPLIGDTLPHAIAQPIEETELIELVRFALSEGMPLVPRAKATSGYGGVMPVKGGIVVDFRRMSQVLSIDREGLTATVQPGIVWRFLDRELLKEGLTLRLYPTSYPSSTVGGWLAQGGAGIGSYSAGWFRDNVVSARIVLPDGTVRTLSGDDLDLISDAEGITGLISEVTIKVQPAEAQAVFAAEFTNPKAMVSALVAVTELDLPLFSVSFINPKMAELKNKSPEKVLHDLPHVEHADLPEAYIALFTYRASDAEAVEQSLSNAVFSTGGRALDSDLAAHEWDERFNLLKVKRLGPSLVPAEVVVPLRGLAGMLAEIERKLAHPIVLEGVLTLKSWSDDEGKSGQDAYEAVILGFIPHDERKVTFNFAYGAAVTALRIARVHGGRAYSTGIYFTGEGKSVLGKDRLKRLESFKRQVDPTDIMNPGKVFGKSLVSQALGLALAFEPIVRPFANAAKAEVGEKIGTEEIAGIPADVAHYAYSCSQCGYCVDDCDQFYGRGWESQSPRGKWYFLRQVQEGKADWDQRWVDTFMVCTTCELCNVRCPIGLPIEPSWMKIRGKKIHEEKQMTIPPFEMMAAALSAEGNIWAGYRKDRTEWFPKDMIEKHGPDHKASIVYFAGCTASYVEHDIGQAAVRLLDEAGVDFTYLGEKENCCATPMLVAGKWDLFAETMKANIEAVKEAGADTVVASCPACDMMWRQAYPEWCKKLGIDYDLKVKHYTEILAEKIESGEFKFPEKADGEAKAEPVKVTWHDSCHIGRASGVYEPPRILIEAVPGTELVEMEHNRREAHCCGSVLTLLKAPNVAHDIGKIRLDEADATGAEKVLALCPCCQFQLRVSKDKRGSKVEVEDLARYAARALGYEFPDPNPEVRAQWAVFEGMIALMTPEGFAGLMGTMLPELVDAMPFGMGTMMRAMGKLPAPMADVAFGAMRPMFPFLFPRLLPMMMPKVMPTMLGRVGEAIPMPDYMREQMPSLMPQVMGNLMPKMLPSVVPLVTEPLISYLRGADGKQEVQAAR